VNLGESAIAIFCMPEEGHFRQLRPLISDLAQSGFAIYVFTHRRFGPEVERCGARTVDLFEKCPIDCADSESIPVPCRYVTFAAEYADDVVEQLKEIQPVLILYETFAVIARLAAQLLGVPYVNVSTGHNLDPARYLPHVQVDPRTKVSDHCHRAVEILCQRYGWSDASPFCYLSGLSPYLNISSEPVNFLTDEERKVFEPIAFYGSLSSSDVSEAGDESLNYFDVGKPATRLYVCLGTVAAKYYPDAAASVIQAVSDYVETMPTIRALISLGGVRVGEDVLRKLTKPNVEIAEFVNQWEVLRIADAFLTHNGLNSTHEAIFHRVPMLSYPMFMDQPALAERCRQFGLAVPLAASVRATVDAMQVRTALNALMETSDTMKAKLSEARAWEVEVMTQRPLVLERILDLVASGRQASVM
jgi:UDP:flavonoid glycosyltransferase YjiC (YdhE family)